MTETKLPSNVKPRIETDSDLTPLRVDPNIIRRVLENLISNSVDAMPMGGKLTLRTRMDSEWVYIDISDTGLGITEDEKPRIWEPFHTTKNRGFGLGLPFCKRAVEGHGGSIIFKSRVGKGTTFTIKFPRALVMKPY